ncbi:MAG: 8-amino-7-oxononanoate synthase [Bacteroides sp.]|nr:8-amino-7-oxononanoate synthase [Bacteroides sp.]MCM1412853.1 8-amino-7-oxononanoate synthase [Bacteroides sp.]MCM1471522.1 8-amino-7-oxononanoate synthase [Bacteroides sp.]
MSFHETLDRLRASGNFRAVPPSTVDDGLVDLTGNDYLGLATDRALIDEFMSAHATDIPAMTSAASRLLASDQKHYELLERRLSQLYGGRSILLFNSGYHANTGMISALASEPSTLIVADRLVHASIIDGIILSRAPYRRFRHNDLDHLEQIIERQRSEYKRIIIVVESVYSMDGDSPDMSRLTGIRRRYPETMLYIDEAHAFGVTGPEGMGMSQALPNPEDVDVIVGTFGKAAASMGAFIATSPTIRDYAVNRARSFIFSTALPPVNVAWTHFMVDRITRMDDERQHLLTLARRLHDRLSDLPAMKDTTPSHITPLIVGDPKAAVELSQKLRIDGFKVLAIRTPTVPPGTERLRISLNARLSETDIDRLAAAIKSHL